MLDFGFSLKSDFPTPPAPQRKYQTSKIELYNQNKICQSAWVGFKRFCINHSQNSSPLRYNREVHKERNTENGFIAR